MLRDDTSPVKADIKALREKVPQITFGACNNTKKGMEKREGKTIVMIPEAHLVPPASCASWSSRSSATSTSSRRVIVSGAQASLFPLPLRGRVGEGPRR